jgi:AraC-like DNA-binding protein
MPNSVDISAALPRSLLQGLLDFGLNLDALAAEIGATRADLEAPLGAQRADQFLRRAFEQAADPSIGLFLGTPQRPELYGVVGYAAMTSADFGSALRRSGRYKRLIWGDEFTLQIEGERARLSLVLSGSDASYVQSKIDMELASMLNFGRRYTGVEIVPLAVYLRTSSISYAVRYEEIFRCALHLGSSFDGMDFRSADVALPLIGANAPIAGLFEQHADAALSNLETIPLVDRVRQSLRETLRGDPPDLGSMARNLCMSERTLQRHLRDAGFAFTELVDQVRQELARDYLRNRKVTISEVSFLLGFATTHSFFRAFRRWFGTTPNSYRASLNF